MSAFNTICLLIVLFVLNGKSILGRKCPKDSVDFATKVENSSIVVYGQAEGKDYNISNPSIFNIKFRVDCILKGPPMPKYIMISQAGRVEGKTFCQNFLVGWDKIVAFLEMSSSNDSTIYTPSDFIEATFKDENDDEESSSDVLANTCGLEQQEPIDATLPVGRTCPEVSTNSSCVRTTIKPKVDNDINGSGLSPIVIPDGSQRGLDDIQGKSGTIQVDVDRQKNGIGSINLSVFLILTAISFVQLN